MVCRSSKIAQKLPPLETPCLEIASTLKWVVIWKNSPMRWCIVRTPPRVLDQATFLLCFSRPAACSRIIAWNHFRHARCAVTTGIGIGTLYRYRSSSKVSVLVVSVNSGIGLTLLSLQIDVFINPLITQLWNIHSLYSYSSCILYVCWAYCQLQCDLVIFTECS